MTTVERNADLAVFLLLVVVAIKVMFPSNRPFSGDILFWHVVQSDNGTFCF
jgi:hypothetical protein